MKSLLFKIAHLVVLLLFLVPAALASEFDHSLFDSLLKNNVRNGLVDYKNIIEREFSLLRQYLEQLECVNPEEFDRWDRDTRMAFCINAYNAITIYAIVEHYPIEYGGIIARARFPKSSIRQINKVWDTMYIKIMGKSLTLNQIEHEILRKEFGDPRIHFAIVCASIGCPKLHNAVYLPETLDDQLDMAATQFITSEIYVSLNMTKNELYLSSIFNWYKEDFHAGETVDWVKQYGKKEWGIIQFIVRYLDASPEVRDYLKHNKLKITYLDYDWSLNEWRKSS